MLDPRVYRMSWVFAALALVVLAFSLNDQPGPRESSIAPSAFSGQATSATLVRLAHGRPNRAPGSPGDDGVAGAVARALGSRADGFSVQRDFYAAHTIRGTRVLENVLAVRPGTDSGGGAVVVVASRDAAGAPARAALTGTATLLELGHVLGGETLTRTVVLASVSGSEGAAGTSRLVSELRASTPVDAVLVLGDLGAAAHRRPTVIPWTMRRRLAPAELRATVSHALATQGSQPSPAPGVLAQLAHLAFPLTVSEQGPLGDDGLPAVEVSFSGERGPAAHAAVADAAGLSAAGQGVLSAVSALDRGAAVAAPSAYVVFDHELVPSWSMALFVLTLILPVLLTTIDGVARARRRRYLRVRSLTAVLAAGAPFLVALAVVLVGRAAGAFTITPQAPGADEVRFSGAAATALAIAGVLAALSAASAFLAHRAAQAGGGRGARWAQAPGSAPEADPERGAVRPAAPERRDRRLGAASVDRAPDGIAAALLLVLCTVALLIWIANPFAAALLVPALHLWLWALDRDLPLPAPARIAMVLLGSAPVVGLVIFYARSLGFSASGVAWEAVLLLAGHEVSLVAAVEWCLVLGCGLSALALTAVLAHRPLALAAPVTVRGPATYAGPGSLGGTKSALRR